jgi:hypothetical protein
MVSITGARGTWRRGRGQDEAAEAEAVLLSSAVAAGCRRGRRLGASYGHSETRPGVVEGINTIYIAKQDDEGEREACTRLGSCSGTFLLSSQGRPGP